MQDRRKFLKQLAIFTGGVVLVPYVTACESTPAVPDKMPDTDAVPTDAKGVEEAAKVELENMMVPTTKPNDWNAIEFNRARGNAGAIPESYWKSINGLDGEKKHLGKHLPYIPEVDAALVPAGFIALMWGDPAKGYAKHPNSAKSEAKPEGHWYNSIKIRKAVEGEAEELQSNFSDWPGIAEGDNGSYAVFGGGKMTDDGGRNAIYLAALPKDVQKGDTIRIWAHCLTHGEYVDYITV